MPAVVVAFEEEPANIVERFGGGDGLKAAGKNTVAVADEASGPATPHGAGPVISGDEVIDVFFHLDDRAKDP
jgi:hypothetical protein